MEKVTLKLCMILDILSAPRAQTLQALDFDHTAVVSNNISFHITSLLKTDKQGQKTDEEIHMSVYAPDKRLCVLHVLTYYLERTEKRDASNTQLLVSYRHPHEPFYILQRHTGQMDKGSVDVFRY